MKHTAQQLLIETIIPILKTQRNGIEPNLQNWTSFKTWKEFIEALKSDPEILDWVSSELFTGTCGDEFIVPEFKNIIERWDENDVAEYFVVINVSGKFIMTKYSEYKNCCWRKIEFFFVERETIMVPVEKWIVK